MAKKKLIVANWKMYITSAEEAREFVLTLRRKARSVPGVEVAVAPPFLFLPEVADVLKSSPIMVGAQSVSAYPEGAHTGDVSATMLREAGAQFAIVGHSERRASSLGGGENNESVRGQLECAIEAKLVPILCIGERERDKEGEHFEFVAQQLTSAIRGFPHSLAKLVVAYEPVWAIGKHAQDAMKPQELQEVTIFIRKVLTDLLGRAKASRVPIIYGGSVEPENVAALLAEGGVAGFLVGHASANLDSFLEIIKLCKK